MSGHRTPQPPNARRKGASPAERSEEFTATQRRLKQEAADRRKAAQGDAAPAAPAPAADEQD